MIARTNYSSDRIVAERGERIYREQYQTAYEKEYSGQYVAIDILTKRSYVASFPDEAIEKARAAAPEGLFHLIRIQTPSVFQLRIRSYGLSRSSID